MRDGLKNCPFCGGDAEMDSARGYRNMRTGHVKSAAAIYCLKCYADMTWCYEDTPHMTVEDVCDQLSEQWNARAPVPA